MSPFLWLISLSFLKYVYPVVSNRFYGTFGPYIYLSTLLNMLQATLRDHATGNPPSGAIFYLVPHGTSTSEQSGPISMSTMISNIMWLIKDDEITVSSEYVEQIMELFCLSPGEIWCIPRNKFDLIFGVRMLEFEFELNIPGNIFFINLTCR